MYMLNSKQKFYKYNFIYLFILVIGRRCDVNQWLDFSFIRYYKKSNRLSKHVRDSYQVIYLMHATSCKKHVMLLHNGKKLPKAHMKSTFVINDRNGVVTQGLLSYNSWHSSLEAKVSCNNSLFDIELYMSYLMKHMTHLFK